MTSVLSELLETFILGRLLPLFDDLSIPHINQTGFCKHVVGTDVIFITTTVLLHYLHESETIYLCCYDPQRQLSMMSYCLYNSSDPLHLSLVQECRFLEEYTGLNPYTGKVLAREYEGQTKALPKEIMAQDWKLTL